MPLEEWIALINSERERLRRVFGISDDDDDIVL
jgi:hypothetical protein